MYYLDHCQILVLPLFLSLTLAQNAAFQTIFSLSIYSSQKPCAQSCFTNGIGNGNVDGCFGDHVGNAIGCANDGLCGQGSSALAPNDCYCRTDLQSVAKSYLTSCVKAGCTVGDSSIDIASAGSIYDYYCSSLGFPVNLPASTTAQSGTQATKTAYVTLHRSSAV
jgi:hypothetical protein